MNVPPQEFTRVAPDRMRAFVTAAFEQVGVSTENAGLLARLLVTNDLRGVFSHGTVRAREALVAPPLTARLRARRRGKAGRRWHADETYVRVRGVWCYR